jgi:putative transposase
MTGESGHRKLVKHYEEAGSCRELTFSCYRRQPLLRNEPWLSLLSESIDRANENHRFGLAAFVYMPEHVHLLVFPLAGASGIDELLKAIKRPYSYRVKQLLIERKSPWLEKLTVRQRPGVNTFRFWQEGPGYDRNLISPQAVDAAIEYLHNNPVRRGLCTQATEWRWSSVRFYLQDAQPSDSALPRLMKTPAEFWVGHRQ